MKCAALAAAVFALLVVDALAGGPCSGVKGGCGRSTYRSTPYVGTYVAPDPPTPTTCAHVKAYTRKDGTQVAAHTRGCDGSGADDTDVVSSRTRDTYRVGARTTPRTMYWNGTESAYDDDKRLAWPEPEKPKTQARYIVIFVSGRKLPAVSYKEEGESYLVDTVEGGHARYPKKMVASIEDAPAPPPVAAPQSLLAPP